MSPRSKNWTVEETATYLERRCGLVLGLLGRPIPGQMRVLRFGVVLSIYMVNVAQLLAGATSRWPSLDARFRTIEDLFVVTFMTVLAFDMLRSPEKFTFMFAIMRDREQAADTATARNIITVTKEKEVAATDTFFRITFGFAFVNGAIPFAYGLYCMGVGKGETPTPIEGWLPFAADTVVAYAALVAPQAVCFLLSGCVAFCWFSAIICSFLHVEKQLQLLCLSISQIDDMARLHADIFALNSAQQNRLRRTLGQIIANHQMVNSAVAGLNKVLALTILLVNYVSCAQMCVILYSFFENKEMTSRIKYLLLLIPVFSCLFYFCWHGQQIINKSEQLERAVAECGWLNKPAWFKRSLRIIMLRTSQPLLIKPFRLYVLNLNNLMMVCQAAYSYFSVMHKMQGKQKYQ